MASIRSRITIFLGIFSVMALSNAIVPVLTGFADRPSWTGTIYAAYFLGAFLSTLPAGILSDRSGRIILMRIGLLLTVVSGIWLWLPGDPSVAVTARFIEGIGAGLFVAPALAWVNRDAEHMRESGYFLALMNAGLVFGLLTTGFLAAEQYLPRAGLLVFTLLAGIAALTSFLSHDPPKHSTGPDHMAFRPLVRRYRGVLYSSVILIGITGVITSLYPEFSGMSPENIGLWTAGMSVATIGAVLTVSRISLNDIRTLQVSAVLMTAGVVVTFISPLGFLAVGFIAGVVMIAQMSLLARDSGHQGVAMGLFSTASYLGMAALPFLAGFIADIAGFTLAFVVTALVALTIIPAVRGS